MAEGALHDGAASACDAPQADARGARPAARSGAGAVPSTRTAPPARAAAGSTQRASAWGARVRVLAGARCWRRGADGGGCAGARPGRGGRRAVPRGNARQRR